jgi:hypothetical protein
MSFASSMFRRVGAVFNQRQTGSRRRSDEFRGRPESRPRVEPLEDRRLMSYTVVNLKL